MTIRLNAKIVVKFEQATFSATQYSLSVTEEVRLRGEANTFRDKRPRAAVNGTMTNLITEFETAYPAYVGALNQLMNFIATKAETAVDTETGDIP